MNTEITLLKWPGDEDWMFAKSCALVTIGKHSGKAPDMEWKHRMLRAKHSPIRTLNFAFYLHNVPYYVSTHLARHVHSVPFIKSQRNDRQSDYDRNAARQDAPKELETKLYTVRKELKNCYENCFGAVGDHADTGA